MSSYSTVQNSSKVGVGEYARLKTGREPYGETPVWLSDTWRRAMRTTPPGISVPQGGHERWTGQKRFKQIPTNSNFFVELPTEKDVSISNAPISDNPRPRPVQATSRIHARARTASPNPKHPRS